MAHIPTKCDFLYNKEEKIDEGEVVTHFPNPPRLNINGLIWLKHISVATKEGERDHLCQKVLLLPVAKFVPLSYLSIVYYQKFCPLSRITLLPLHLIFLSMCSAMRNEDRVREKLARLEVNISLPYVWAQLLGFYACFAFLASSFSLLHASIPIFWR